MEILPDRQAQQRLDEWRIAERQAAREVPGTLGALRAHSARRRARWAFEDAATLAAAAQGRTETMERRTARVRLRSDEVTDEASARIAAGWTGVRDRPVHAETPGERDVRVRQQAEIDRETGDSR